ncbi:sigma-70 family RNA polymerase sigma factor [Brevundimonas sp. AJA228-03]|uniref:RNA polymerase sigma factor n=1 Tax=Brevundimonas sp. AJA228-03 TaxID=2752515 RepID=UPI001ADF6512|nr:sigma-70 family RNA polymerase sigma factor [Brevundimonas sp. AJA228-03]QTN20693.1 sigma-70 family RNA polymerase sigma factor [Brevundimonas sp. AJA228-03]
MSRLLDQTFRDAGGRVVSALAAAFRDLDLAEEAFAEACARALERWGDAPPADPAAWLYAVARRRVLDRYRRRATAAAWRPDDAAPEPTPEDHVMALDEPIPDERLRLIFVCCHPAVSPDARAALTLRTVCGLSTAEVAAAFLTPEPTLAQRLVRAKRKIAEAGVPYDVPSPDRWPERMDAVLSTLEVAYAQAHADAAGAGPHADFAAEMLNLTGLLARLAPDDAEAQALAATVRYTEARRPARLSPDGAMVPLTEQNTADWDAALIAEAGRFMARSAAASHARRTVPGPRALQAAIHGAHADRARTGRTDWAAILGLYNLLLLQRDDPVIRTNRAVALAEIEGPAAALDALLGIDVQGWLPLHAARAGMFARLGRDRDARQAYDTALALGPSPAEALFLKARRDRLDAAA